MTDHDPDPFSPEVVAAIKAHMNGDHGEDSLLICRTLGGQPGAAAARVECVNGEGIDFTAVVAGVEVTVRLDWSERLVERAQVRTELVRMTDEARRAAGLPSRIEPAGDPRGH